MNTGGIRGMNSNAGMSRTGASLNQNSNFSGSVNYAGPTVLPPVIPTASLVPTNNSGSISSVPQFTPMTPTTPTGAGPHSPYVPTTPHNPYTPVNPAGPTGRGPSTPTPVNPTPPHRVSPNDYDVEHMTHGEAIRGYVNVLNSQDIIDDFQEYLMHADINMDACATVILDTMHVDNISGTNEDDYIFGLQNNDVIYGNGGDDAIFAGESSNDGGPDILIGDWDLRSFDMSGAEWNSQGNWGYGMEFQRWWNPPGPPGYTNGGNGQVEYHSGDDIIFGNDADNIIIGDNVLRVDDADAPAFNFMGKMLPPNSGQGSGQNAADIEEGHDWLYGRDGDDIIVGDSWYALEDGQTADLFDHTNDGNDVIFGGSGNDIIFGDDGYVENIVISESLGIMDDPQSHTSHVANGERFPNTPHAGDDLLYGEEGDDTIYGGHGDDVLNGGEGYDTLYGGEGDDTFVFDTYDGVDAVMDFEANDLIALTESMFDVSAQDVQAAIDDFVMFSTVNNETYMLVDSDGSAGPGQAELVAVFDNPNGMVFDAVDMLSNGQIDII